MHDHELRARPLLTPVGELLVDHLLRLDRLRPVRERDVVVEDVAEQRGRQTPTITTNRTPQTPMTLHGCRLLARANDSGLILIVPPFCSSVRRQVLVDVRCMLTAYVLHVYGVSRQPLSQGIHAMAQRTESKQREKFTRDRIIDAALQIMDDEGLDAVSMRRVGRELGVEAMSLYHHVRDKDDLLARHPRAGAVRRSPIRAPRATGRSAHASGSVVAPDPADPPEHDGADLGVETVRHDADVDATDRDARSGCCARSGCPRTTR